MLSDASSAACDAFFLLCSAFERVSSEKLDLNLSFASSTVSWAWPLAWFQLDFAFPLASSACIHDEVV